MSGRGQLKSSGPAGWEILLYSHLGIQNKQLQFF